MTDTRTDAGGREALPTPAGGVRTFAILVTAQFVAISAVTLLNFAAAHLVYTTYSLAVLGVVYALPFVLLLGSSPFSGALVDRWGVRRALVVGNTGCLVLTVAATAVLPLAGETFPLWFGVVVVATVPLLKGLLLPAIETAVPLLVPRRHLGRANGSRMIVNGFGAVVLPYVAIALGDAVGLLALSALVAVLLLAALAVTWRAHVPIPAAEPCAPARPGVLLTEFRVACRDVRSRPGLPALLAFFGVVSFAFGITEVLVPQIVTAFADAELVPILVVGFVGMAVSTVVATVWGGPRAAVRGLLVATVVLAAAMLVGSVRPSVPLLSVAAFAFLASTTFVVGLVQTVLHRTVPARLLGRVMALKNVVYSVALMIGDIGAGLGGALVMPLVGEYEVRSPAVAAVFGGGAGRGFAVLLALGGALIAVAVLCAARHRPLRALDGAVAAPAAAGGGRVASRPASR